MTDTATVGHNSAAVGEMLAENPNLLFTETGMLESLLDEVKAEIDAANKAAAEAQAELDRQAQQKAEEERAAAAREADIAHRSSVMRAAKDALMETVELSEADAKKVVLAISAGSIPNVTLRF